ncbi:hypothetical protein [Kordiimonas sp.]|uniref:hypothetical protein n=1 Tax=Kordiimonas sp. TaxID=1970157 RepID=UPI003A8CBF36
MHEHDINVQTFLGPVSAQVDHKPLNSDELEVRIHLKKLPKIFSGFIPAQFKRAPIVKVLKRAFVRSWGEKLIRWSNEPVERRDDA